MFFLKWIVWLALAILCASVMAGRVEGAWAWVWVPAAFYAPWALRAAIRGDKHEAGNERFWSLIIAICLLALISSGCATRSTLDVAAIKKQIESNYSDRTVTIHSAPSGAMIDLNGDVIGITPCTLELKRCFRDSWPANGLYVQVLRARWLDGFTQEQHFHTVATPPKRVAYIHPHATQKLMNRPQFTPLTN